MLNESRKVNFAEEYCGNKNAHSTIKALQNISDRIEPLYNKDLCDLSRDEAIEALKSLGAVSYSYVGFILHLVRNYTQWCLNNGLCIGENVYDRLSSGDIDTSERIASNIPRSYDEVAYIIDSAFGNIDEISGSNNCRACVWLSFLGIKIDKAIELKNEDYDGINLYCDGEKLDLTPYPEIRKVLDVCKIQVKYLKGCYYENYPTQNYLIKRYNVEATDIKAKFLRRISDKLTGYAKRTGDQSYTMSNFVKAGLFCRMEAAGDKWTDVANEYIVSNYAGEKSTGRMMTFKVKQLSKEYLAWRKINS